MSDYGVDSDLRLVLESGDLCFLWSEVDVYWFQVQVYIVEKVRLWFRHPNKEFIMNRICILVDISHVRQARWLRIFPRSTPSNCCCMQSLWVSYWLARLAHYEKIHGVPAKSMGILLLLSLHWNRMHLALVNREMRHVTGITECMPALLVMLMLMLMIWYN